MAGHRRCRDAQGLSLIHIFGASPKNYQHIPNGVDFREEPENLPPKKHQELLELLHSRGHFVLLYLGGFSAANALEDLVFAAALAPPGIAFVSVSYTHLSR